MAGRVLVGISSWTEPTLIKSGGFYPPDATTAEDRLRFYATKFPIVEVDSTFYALPSAQTAALWVERTPAGFVLDVKAFALLTQHPAPPQRLPKDLRERLGSKTRNVYFKDLKPKDKEEVWERFRAGLQPLTDAKKLGAIVFQFPKWFLPNPPAYRFMEDLREWLPDAPLTIEFRQQAWMSDVRRDRVLQFLKDHGLTYVAVDEPQGFQSSVPPISAATAPLAMVRFHGRNRDTWEKKGITTAEKFRYLYDRSELAPWVARVRELAQQAQDVHVVFNNCYGDYAVQNARDFTELLEG